MSTPPDAVAPRSDLEALARVLGHRFSDRGLLERALVHASNRGQWNAGDNETLEFLGDAVIDLVIAERLLEENPNSDEGQLSRLRAALVSARGLASLAEELGLAAWIRLGPGEEHSGGRAKPNILAGCYEAVVGAIFLDGGYDAARDAVREHFGGELSRRAQIEVDYKTALQEATQACYKTPPEYRVTSVRGPDHDRRYRGEVLTAGGVAGSGGGSSRNTAGQAAARHHERWRPLHRPE